MYHDMLPIPCIAGEYVKAILRFRNVLFRDLKIEHTVDYAVVRGRRVKLCFATCNVLVNNVWRRVATFILPGTCSTWLGRVFRHCGVEGEGSVVDLEGGGDVGGVPGFLPRVFNVEYCIYKAFINVAHRLVKEHDVYTAFYPYREEEATFIDVVVYYGKKLEQNWLIAVLQVPDMKPEEAYMSIPDTYIEEVVKTLRSRHPELIRDLPWAHIFYMNI